MIKRISAIVLALVLCLSVMVFPASAGAELNGTQAAFALKWDKEYYKAGDTATLYLYLAVQDDIPLSAGTLTIGFNSATISPDDNNPIDCITASELHGSYFMDPASSTYTAQSKAQYQSKIEGKNTADENATYDWYFRTSLTKNSEGTHENANSNTDGLYGSEIDPTVPFLTFTFKVAEGVAEGTKIPAAITSGCATCTPAQLQLKYYSKPGTGTTTSNIAAAQYDVSAAVATATVGTPAPTYPDFTINQGKDAIRFNKNTDNSYKDISIRTTAEIAIADLQGACDGKTANDDIENYITEVGFVYIPATETFSVDAAKAAITAITEDEGESNGYTKKMVSYIQKTDTSYKYACVVDVKDEAIASAAFNTFAYICLDFDGDGTTDKTYYYEAANSVSAKTLYNKKYGQANSTYGWTLAGK